MTEPTELLHAAATAVGRKEPDLVEEARARLAPDAPVDPHDAQAFTRATVQAVLDAVAEGRLRDRDRQFATDTGRSQAAEGRPMDGLLGILHTTVTVVQNRLVTEVVSEAGARSEGNGEHSDAPLLATLEAVRDAEAELRAALEEGFHEAWRARPPDADSEPILETLLFSDDPSAAVEPAGQRGVDLTTPFRLVALVGRGQGRELDERPRSSLHRLATELAHEGAPDALGPLVVDPTEDTPAFALLLVPDQDDRPGHGRAGQPGDAQPGDGQPQGGDGGPTDEGLVRECVERGFVALSAAVRTVDDARAAFRRLRVSTPLAERCALFLGPVIDVGRLLPYRLISAMLPEDQEDLVKMVQPVFHARSAAGVDSVRAMVGSQRVAVGEAARRLGVSRNTAKYRLERIEELTGRSLTEDRFLFEAALLLLDFWGDELPGFGDPWWLPPE